MRLLQHVVRQRRQRLRQGLGNGETEVKLILTRIDRGAEPAFGGDVLVRLRLAVRIKLETQGFFWSFSGASESNVPDSSK